MKLRTETLSKWDHLERRILGPGSFIPLAGKTGLIDEPTNQNFLSDAQQNAEWPVTDAETKRQAALPIVF